MKAKTNPTAPALPAITHPTEILKSHLKPALEPFAAELLEAARIDREAAGVMDTMHPEKVKAAAEDLFYRAARGEEAAEKELREAGGKAEYIAKRTAFFDLAKAKHHAACQASAPLWQKVSEAIVAGIDAAAAEIQKQLDTVAAALGEPAGLSNWDAYCRNLKSGISRAPFAAEKLNHGTDWMLRSLGLADLVGLE
jgi:hypothetical protein